MPQSLPAPRFAQPSPGSADILCLDTCFGACSVALFRQLDPAARRPPALYPAYEGRQTGHAEALMPMLERVLAAAAITPGDIQLIVATHGPGSFTGVRAGVAAARGLALALGITAVGVSSLAVMATMAIAEIHEDERLGRLLVVAMPAGREHFYVEAFGATLDDRFTAGPQLMTADAVAAIAPLLPMLAVGAGARAIAEAVRRAGREVRVALEALQPDARFALAVHAGHGDKAALPIRPLYLRPPDAKPQGDKALPRAD